MKTNSLFIKTLSLLLIFLVILNLPAYAGSQPDALLLAPDGGSQAAVPYTGLDSANKPASNQAASYELPSLDGGSPLSAPQGSQQNPAGGSSNVGTAANTSAQQGAALSVPALVQRAEAMKKNPANYTDTDKTAVYDQLTAELDSRRTSSDRQTIGLLLDAIAAFPYPQPNFSRDKLRAALSAIGHFYNFGSSSAAADFAVREKAYRAQATYFAETRLSDAERLASINRTFEFFKNPNFFDADKKSIVSGWETDADGNVTRVGYTIYISALYNKVKQSLAVSDPLRDWVINAWSSIYTEVSNFDTKFRNAFPPIPTYPYTRYDYDFFRSVALYAESAASVEKVVAAILPNTNQAFIYRTHKILVLSSNYTWTNADFQNIKDWLSGYPPALIRGLGLMASGPEFFAGQSSDIRGGKAGILTDEWGDMYLMLGRPVNGSGQPYVTHIHHNCHHEFGHIITDALNDPRFLPEKRWIMDEMFRLGTPQDRPDASDGAVINCSTCQNAGLAYANNNSYENKAEFWGLMIKNPAAFFQKWIDRTRTSGRFIGIRTLLSMMEILANADRNINFSPNTELYSRVYANAVTDSRKNITRLTFPFNGSLPAALRGKIFEFEYTSDSLHVTKITIKDSAGNIIEVINNNNFDTTPPAISAVQAVNITSSGATVNWNTNEAADTQVEYSTNANMAGAQLTSLDANKVTSHSTNLSGLNANTTYYYRVRSRDAAGNLQISQVYNFRTLQPQDTAPPVISAVQATNITASGAAVSWATNEASDTQVEYSLYSSMYGSQMTALNNAMVTSHTANLSGLNANTTYYYRVRSRDAAGNLQVSNVYNFRTLQPADTTPPQISAVQATNITASGAAVSWATNEASDTQVEYSLYSSMYGSQMTALNNAMVTSHTANLSGLSSNTTYYYRVRSRDAAGNLQISQVYNFRTLQPPDTTPPQISAVQATNITSSGATISWNTNEASDTQVEYSIYSSMYGAQMTALNGNMMTSHTANLNGLSSNTTYYYRVRSRDAAGNLTVSQIYNFRTLAPADVTPPYILSVSVNNITSGSASVSWTTNEASDSQVEFSTNWYMSGPQFTQVNTNLTTNHTVNLSGLSASTTYYYRVRSRDAAGNLQISGVYSFRTQPMSDTTPPAVTTLTSFQTSYNSYQLNWQANEKATSQVRFSANSNMSNSQTVMGGTNTTQHSARLTNLQPGRYYYYQIILRDAAGNESIGPVYWFYLPYYF